MDWQDDETRHPWEQGGDLPWADTESEEGWLPPDPEAWREDDAVEFPVWPEFAAGTEVWQQDVDDED